MIIMIILISTKTKMQTIICVGVTNKQNHGGKNFKTKFSLTFNPPMIVIWGKNGTVKMKG